MGSVRRVQFRDDTRRPARAGVLCLAFDFREQRLMQGEGRVEELAQARNPGQAGELQEDLMDVLADRFVCRHQAVIRV